MVGTQHVDQHVVAARYLVGMIGDVIGEVGVRSVRLAQRPVDVVAELGRAEQGLRARFPVLRRFPLGRFQHAFVDQSIGVKLLDNGVGGAGGDQVAFGTVDVLLDAEQTEVFADLGHHGVDGEVFHRIQPGLGGGDAKVVSGQRGLEPLGERVADLDQIVAAILQATGNFAGELFLGHRRADCLEVAPVRRPGEGSDLCPGVIDVVFLGDLEAGLVQQVGQGIADHGAAAVADMHRAGGIGGDILDVDFGPGAGGGVAIVRASLQDQRKQRAEAVGAQA